MVSRAGVQQTPQSKSPASACAQQTSAHLTTFVGPSLHTSEIASREHVLGASEPRSLNNVHISGVEIDALFHLYVRKTKKSIYARLADNDSKVL